MAGAASERCVAFMLTLQGLTQQSSRPHVVQLLWLTR